MIDAITKLLEDERKIHQFDGELLFTLSSRAYKQLKNECSTKRLGTRPCEINKFCSQFGNARILEGKDQSDDILIYKRSG